jgi:hypothetical protein
MIKSEQPTTWNRSGAAQLPEVHDRPILTMRPHVCCIVGAPNSSHPENPFVERDRSLEIGNLQPDATESG